MACPTCTHTMHQVIASNVRKFFWCPRCGTLKEENLIFKEGDRLREGYEVPALVARARGVLDEYVNMEDYSELLSHGGKDSQVFQIGVLLRDAPTQDDRDAILRAAHDHMRDGKIDFRGYDTLVRYAGSKA